MEGAHRIWRAGHHDQPVQAGEGPQGHRRRPRPARLRPIPNASCAPKTRATPAGSNHPARQNHRIIPITIDGQPWFLQYSPYVYYNEHCICLNSGAHAHEDRPRLFPQAARLCRPVPALLRRLERRPAHRGRVDPRARPLPGRALRHSPWPRRRSRPRWLSPALPISALVSSSGRCRSSV